MLGDSSKFYNEKVAEFTIGKKSDLFFKLNKFMENDQRINY